MAVMNNISKIRNFMLFINIVTCNFIALVILFTSNLICSYAKAADFLSTVVSLPEDPDRLFIYTVFICIGFIISFLLRQVFFVDDTRVIYLSLLFDTVLNVLLIMVTDCNYNGFILWLLANIIYYIDAKWKYPVLIMGLVAYMIVSYEIFSIYNSLFSVKSYIAFYPPEGQRLLLFCLNILTAFNFICFVFFCIQVIKQQKDTIEEKERLYSQLEKANRELKNYADIKERMGQTKERNRIAREIHDTVGHSLTGISVGVDTCIAIIDNNPDIVKRQLQVISAVAKDGIADIRRSVRALQDDDLQNELSLEDLIQDMLEKASLSSGIQINFTNNFGQKDFKADEKNTIFRVIQESVTNSIRYSKTKRIDITMDKNDNNLLLVVRDYGQGCKSFEPGFGTSHIRERVEMLHGSIEFMTTNGFTVKAEIPLRGDV